MRTYLFNWGLFQLLCLIVFNSQTWVILDWTRKFQCNRSPPPLLSNDLCLRRWFLTERMAIFACSASKGRSRAIHADLFKYFRPIRPPSNCFPFDRSHTVFHSSTPIFVWFSKREYLCELFWKWIFEILTFTHPTHTTTKFPSISDYIKRLTSVTRLLQSFQFFVFISSSWINGLLCVWPLFSGTLGNFCAFTTFDLSLL